MERYAVVPLSDETHGLYVSSIRVPDHMIDELNAPGASISLEWGTSEHVRIYSQVIIIHLSRSTH